MPRKKEVTNSKRSRNKSVTNTPLPKSVQKIRSTKKKRAIGGKNDTLQRVKMAKKTKSRAGRSKSNVST